MQSPIHSIRIIFICWLGVEINYVFLDDKRLDKIFWLMRSSKARPKNTPMFECYGVGFLKAWALLPENWMPVQPPLFSTWWLPMWAEHWIYGNMESYRRRQSLSDLCLVVLRSAPSERIWNHTQEKWNHAIIELSQ